MDTVKIKRCIPLITIILLSVTIVNGLFYHIRATDNKYSANMLSLTPDHGQITITTDWMDKNPATALVYGWEIRMEDGHASDFRQTYIGQHGSFARGSVSASPYGQAVYRLTLNSPAQPSNPCLLLLPEIFCACRISVNGTVVKTLGNPSYDGYLPYVKNVLIPISEETAVIEIHAANYTHYYSGVTYPPVFGTMDAIQGLAEKQLILYGFLCFFTLGAALVSLAFWISHKKSCLSLIYGLMSLCFAIYISYPLARWMGIRRIRFFYCLEDTAFYGMIVCIIFITQLLAGKGFAKSRLHRCAAAAGVFFCILPCLNSAVLFRLLPQWVSLYGNLVRVYKPLISLYLIAVSLQGLMSRKNALLLFCGNLVFALGLLEDSLTSGAFEPLTGLWQVEYTSFFIVLVFTVLMVRHYRALSLAHEELTRHLEDEVARKTSHLTILLQERRLLLSNIAHDMKAPIAVIKAYIDLIHMEQEPVDEETAGYISIIEQKSASLAKQIQTLQVFNTESAQSDPMVRLPYGDFLQMVYQETKPYADAAGIYFHLQLHGLSGFVHVQADRCLRAFENIIINAAEYTRPGGTITFDASASHGQAVISIKDTGCGIAPENLPRIFDYRFSTSPETEQEEMPRGIGLYFARNTFIEHNGSIRVESAQGLGTEFIITLPLQEGP